MNQKVLDFLDSQSVCCLTVSLPDESLHPAAMHFSHRVDPFTIFFSTDKSSRKCLGLLSGAVVKAAIVVGWSEEDWITLQMAGEIKAVSNTDELKLIQNIHYKKHPGSAKYKDDPATIFLAFTPTWERFTDH